jgi:glycosyltransferase 2 family protein
MVPHDRAGSSKLPLAIEPSIVHGCRQGRRWGSHRGGAVHVLRRVMKRILDFVWPLMGLAAVAVSLWLLHREFKGEAVGPDVWHYLKSVSPGNYLLAVLSTLVAYAALAWYDRIALLHLGVKNISWLFISLCSFTTYALSHNIGATVISGGIVRYRAYHSKGLSAAQVAVLVAVCSLTFLLGTVLLGGLISFLEPEQLGRFRGMLPANLQFLTDPTMARLVGAVFLGAAAVYVVGSIFRFRPLIIRGFRLEYPKPEITARQLVAAPLEILGAAGIIYFVLPEAGNPGYFIVLAVFLFSFGAALWSSAPGGLGVFEWFFISAMPEMPNTQVLAALLVFRLTYLLIPLFLSIFVMIIFERNRLKEVLHHKDGHPVPGVEVKASTDRQRASVP